MESKMTVTHSIMKEVVTQLREAGFDAASYEYPGYISIGKRSYGTANGNWGWNDEDGNGGETLVTGTCTHPETIVAEIARIERHQNEVDSAVVDDKTYLDSVAACLNPMVEYPLDVVHTGGGIFCIVIKPAPRVELYFGTSDSHWGCDIYVDEDFADESINTPFVIDFSNPQQAANVITKIVVNFRRDQMGAILAKADKRKNEKQAERDFQQAMETFRDAAGDLLQKWEQLPAGSNFQDGKATHYPFDMSFDELYHEILDWSFQICSTKV